MVDRIVPNTPAESVRHSRIVNAAETLLRQVGERGLEMKPLAQRAGVALGTLYRYFPSKEHLLSAVALDRHRRSLQHIDSIRFSGASAGDRVADFMLREFRVVQRSPEMGATLQRVAFAPDRATSEYVEEIAHIREAMVVAVISQGGVELATEQRTVLPTVLAAWSGAISHWLNGLISAEDVRARIRGAAKLLDLPPEVIRDYLT